MKSAVITSGEHWLTIDGIEYLRGTIEVIERLTYKYGEQEAVKISGSSVNSSVILVDGTTIDGIDVGSQDELVDFIKQYSFREGGGDGNGVTQQELEEGLETKLSISDYQGMLMIDDDMEGEQTANTLNEKYGENKIRSLVVARNVGSGMLYIKMSDGNTADWFVSAGQVLTQQ